MLSSKKQKMINKGLLTKLKDVQEDLILLKDLLLLWVVKMKDGQNLLLL